MTKQAKAIFRIFFSLAGLVVGADFLLPSSWPELMKMHMWFVHYAFDQPGVDRFESVVVLVFGELAWWLLAAAVIAAPAVIPVWFVWMTREEPKEELPPLQWPPAK